MRQGLPRLDPPAGREGAQGSLDRADPAAPAHPPGASVKTLADYLFWEEPGIQLYCGDCRELLPLVDAANALVTDPPFGISWPRATWADAERDYPELIRWLVRESARVVPIGWCFVFQTMLNVGRFHEWFPPGWRLFAACKNFAQVRPTGVWHSWDPVVFWRNGPHSGPNSGPHSGHVNRDYFVGNVAGSFGERTEHPCPRPVDTMRHIVGLAAPVNGRVIDPFAGSGTTLLAAKEMGRQVVGIEIEPRWCELAVKRLRQGVLPL